MVSKIIWLDVLGIIFLLFAVYLILTTIFGNSATPIEVTVIIFLGLGSLFGSQLYKLNREMGEMKVSVKHSFVRVKDDIHSVKEDVNVIKDKVGKIDEIKEGISLIKNKLNI